MWQFFSDGCLFVLKIGGYISFIVRLLHLVVFGALSSRTRYVAA